MNRFNVVITLVVVAVATILAAVVRGADGAAGALTGGLLSLVFLASTPVVLAPMLKGSATAFSMPIALGFFMIKSIAALAVLAILFDVGGLGDVVDRLSLGLAAMATAFVWTWLTVLAFRRDRTPTYDLPESHRDHPDSVV